MEILRCEGLAFSYEGAQVLSEVSFSLEEGGYISVVGENGSGKSTLIRGIAGLKTPERGSITFSGGLTRREIGYLPQKQPGGEDFPASVMEVVLSGRLSALGHRPFFGSRDREAALEKLRLMGAEELRDCSYRKLSGGQKQRVLLARALCAASRLLLLDEPAAGLDPGITAELYAIIKRLNAENGIAVLMISHDVRAAVRDSDAILHLGRKMRFFGSPQEYEKSEVGRVFLNGEDA